MIVSLYFIQTFDANMLIFLAMSTPNQLRSLVFGAYIVKFAYFKNVFFSFSFYPP